LHPTVSIIGPFLCVLWYPAYQHAAILTHANGWLIALHHKVEGHRMDDICRMVSKKTQWYAWHHRDTCSVYMHSV
jgi:hypothetical protein